MSNKNRILVTGGAGFIGSNFVQPWMQALPSGRSSQAASIVNLDLLTDAGNPANLAGLPEYPPYTLVHGDICQQALVERLFAAHRPRAVVHFAAESHVDRSITGPEAFLRTHIDGTFNLLRAARSFYETLADEAAPTSAFSTYPRTRSTERSHPPAQPSTSRPPTPQTPLTPPPRHRRTTSSTPGSTPTAFRPSSPTVPTTTAPTNSRKS